MTAAASKPRPTPPKVYGFTKGELLEALKVARRSLWDNSPDMAYLMRADHMSSMKHPEQAKAYNIIAKLMKEIA